VGLILARLAGKSDAACDDLRMPVIAYGKRFAELTSSAAALA